MSNKTAIPSQSSPHTPDNAAAATSSSLTSPHPFVDIIEVASGYRGNATLLARAHNIASESFARRNLYLGVPAAVIAAVVGSSIFASLSGDGKNIYLLITTGALSILAAVLSALQTFLKYSEIAQSHKVAKDGYESVRRNIDIFRLQLNGPQPIFHSDAQAALQEIVKQMNDLGKSSPIISTRVLQVAAKDATAISALVKVAADSVAALQKTGE